MKSFFSILTAILFAVGFIAPVAWAMAVVTAIIAIGCAPAGRRADGKRKTGGLLGGVWDELVVATKMKECPFCKSKIMKDASKCSHCGEWVNGRNT